MNDAYIRLSACSTSRLTLRARRRVPNACRRRDGAGSDREPPTRRPTPAPVLRTRSSRPRTGSSIHRRAPVSRRRGHERGDPAPQRELPGLPLLNECPPRSCAAHRGGRSHGGGRSLRAEHGTDGAAEGRVAPARRVSQHPAGLGPRLGAPVLAHFTPAQIVELAFKFFWWSTNRATVTLGDDAPARPRPADLLPLRPGRAVRRPLAGD